LQALFGYARKHVTPYVNPDKFPEMVPFLLSFNCRDNAFNDAQLMHG